VGNTETTELSPNIRRLALGWLGFQYNMGNEEACGVLDGLSTSGSRIGRLRQEALDVAEYAEHVSNG